MKTVLKWLIYVFVSLHIIKIMSNAQDINNLDKEYSPSMWSKRFPTAKEVIDHHEQYVKEASERATNNIPSILDIEYGSKPGQKLDILGTDLPNDAIIFVFIHGGYWQSLSRPDSRYPALSMHPSGIKTIIVGYDLCPDVTLPEIVDEIKNAAKYIFEYAERVGSRGVYFTGHSAGAHLLAKLLSNERFFTNTLGSHRFEGAFLVSGVFNLQDLVKTYVNKLVQLPEERAIEMSPYFDDCTHLRNKNIRIYVFAGQNDSPTFKKQSIDFYDKFKTNYRIKNLNFEIKDNFDHFDIVECYAEQNNFLKSLILKDADLNLRS